MEVNRFKEELPLIKKEMNSFISFYKDRIIPAIDKKEMELQAALNGKSRLFLVCTGSFPGVLTLPILHMISSLLYPFP